MPDVALLTITTTGANTICDASGNAIASGTFAAYATDGNDQPIAFAINGAQQAVKATVTCPIVNGQLSGTLKLANPAITTPTGIRYHVIITNNATNQVTHYPGVSISVATGVSSWDWSLWNPALGVASIPTNIISANTILNGTGAPASTLGKDGDFYLDTGSAKLYGPKAAGAWPGSGTNLIGSGTTAFQVVSLANKLPIGQNLLNQATVTSGFYINGANGATAALAGYYASDFIPVIAGGTVTTNVAIATGLGGAGYAFYDISQTYISGANGTVAANTPITVPAGAAYFRFTGSNAGLSSAMTVNSSSMPSVFIPFTNPTAPSLIQLATYTSKLGLSANLFNSAAITSANYINGANGNLGGTLAGWYASDFIPVIPGTTATVSVAIATGLGGAGYAFYDVNQKYISGANGGVTASTPITVPASALYFRYTGSLSALNTAMAVNGSSVPSVYVPFTNLNAPSMTQVSAWANKLPMGQNLYNVAAITTSAYILYSNGNVITGASSNYSASDYCAVAPGSTIITKNPIGSGASDGYAFYDLNKTFISGGNNVTAGSTISVPVNAAFIRISHSSSIYPPTQMLCQGTVLPSSYVAFYPVSGSGAEAAASATNGKLISYHGDSITQFYRTGANGWGTLVASRIGVSEAFVDARGGRTTQQAFEFYGGFNPYPSLNGTVSSFSIASNVLTINGTFPVAYVTGTKIRLLGLTSSVGTNQLRALELTVLAGATTSTFTATATYGGTAWTFADTGNTTDSGSTIPILANGTLSSFSYVSATNILTVIGSFPAYPAGTVIRLYGLGVGTYLVSNATTDIVLTVQAGANTTSFTATVTANGSAWSHADIGSTTDTGTVISPGHNQGYVWFDATHGPWANNGTPGNTFAQDVRAASPDIYVAFLGTNDGSRTIGSSTDLAGAASEYGDLKALIESVMAAKPGVRMMFVTPYLQSLSAVSTAIKTTANAYGVPVFDMRQGTPMDTPFTWQTNLLSDHTHPSNAGNQVLGGMMAEFIKLNY